MDSSESPPPSANLKAQLRQRMVESRVALHEAQRRRMDRQICVHLMRLLDDRDCVDLAAFLPFRGEPDLTPALEALVQAGRRVWLPVLDGETLRFRRWKPGIEMPMNRFGIPEPSAGPECPPERLELVLTPLVAFSPSGTRLGMGAGYYDRTFEFLRRRPDTGPLLVGIAYGLQEINSLPAESWDVPLASVITERGLRVFRE